MKYNYLDLFSGIGGFRLGLEMAGFEFNKTYHSDIEEYPNKIYKQHWKDSVQLGDISKVNPHDLGRIDIVTGGFPCQDISIAGKQKGLEDEEGERTRSGLFYEIIRLCGVLRPKVILLENVANLLTHNGGRTFGTVLGELSKIGYDAEWEIISAKDVGMDHKRERIWIVAYSKSSRYGGGTSKKCDISGVLAEKEQERCRFWSKIERCIVLTLQGKKTFPEDIRGSYGIPDWTHRVKALGNAVVPQVVELIGRKILESGVL